MSDDQDPRINGQNEAEYYYAMEAEMNKTPEQLASEYATKTSRIYKNGSDVFEETTEVIDYDMRDAYLTGYKARQPEIDELVEALRKASLRFQYLAFNRLREDIRPEVGASEIEILLTKHQTAKKEG